MLTRITLIFLTLCLSAPQYAVAGWGPSASAPVGAYKWQAIPDAPDQMALYQGNVQIGSYNYASSVYREYNARTQAWGRVCAPPVAPPARTEQLPSPTVFGAEIPPGCRMVIGPDGKPAIDCGGMKPDQMSKSTEVFWQGDRKLSREKHERSLGDPAVPDDAGKHHVVVVCADKTRRDDLTGALEKSPTISQKATVHVYDPADRSNWALEVLKLNEDTRFKQTGSLTLLQAPKDETGKAKPLKAWYSGEPSAITLAVDRTIDPHYKPDSVPDGNAKPLIPAGNRLVVPGAILAGAGALVYLSRRTRANVGN